ncbi:MAG: hypothetical protein WCA21_18030 [Terracidiphilus sp.]
MEDRSTGKASGKRTAQRTSSLCKAALEREEERGKEDFEAFINGIYTPLQTINTVTDNADGLYGTKVFIEVTG